jgi:mono/diheme cytochrome c family protein
VLIALGLTAVGVAVGWVVGYSTRHTPTVTVAATGVSGSSGRIDTHVAAGAHDFVQFACSQCHGPQGRGGVSPVVPSLTNVAKTVTPRRLRFIIDHGLGESKNPT